MVGESELAVQGQPQEGRSYPLTGLLSVLLLTSLLATGLLLTGREQDTYLVVVCILVGV